MFRTRILLQRIKHSTGLVGLPVVPNAREVLAELYNTTLINIQKIPQYAEYRKSVEAFTKYRLNIVKNEENIEKIEDLIGCGQVEELIEQARDELELLDKFHEWKLWEGPMPIEDLEPDTGIYTGYTSPKN